MGKTCHLQLLGVVLLLVASLNMLAQPERDLYVTVETSKSARIDGLTKEHFTLFENGKQQEIVGLETAAEPASVGVLFDVSNSVLNWGPKDLNAAIEGLARMVDEGSASNEYFLMSFNKEISLLQDWTAEPAKFHEGLQKLSVSSSKATGSTSLHDAFVAALQRLEFGKFRKRALIVFSDGQDSSMKPRKKDVFELLRKSSAIVFFVTVLESERYSVSGSAGPYQSQPRGGSLGEMRGIEFVNDVTGLSGGRIYSVVSTKPASAALKSDEFPLLEGVFVRLQNDFASQYKIKYLRSITAGDKAVRNIDLKVAIPKDLKKDQGFVKVRFRREYAER